MQRGIKPAVRQFEKHLLDMYVEIAYPVSWLRWLTQLPRGSGRSRLHGILFDSNDRLRDLTAPGISSKISNCASHDRVLRKLICVEMWLFLEECARQARATYTCSNAGSKRGSRKP